MLDGMMVLGTTPGVGKTASAVELDVTKPVASDGGSSPYYDRVVPEWLLQNIVQRDADGLCYIKTEELIEIVFNNDFDFGTAFKSLVRAHGAVNGGGKVGNTANYELNKVKYYADKIKAKEERNAD